MKLFVFFLVIILTAAVFADGDQEWEAFKIKFSKLFLSKNKEGKRKAAFLKNVAHLKSLQDKYEAGKISYKPEMYEYHDLDHEERMERMTGAIEVSDEGVEVFDATSRQALPTSYSAVSILNPIKNQGGCGSCWAFSVMNAVEGAYTTKTGLKANLSEQFLVDCQRKYDNGTLKNGCKGGNQPGAIKWLAANGGAVLSTDYPYTGVFGTCDMNKPRAVPVLSVTQIKNETDIIKNAIMQYGSLSISVNASEWFHYGSGVLTAKYGGGVNHATNVVGWGFDATVQKEFWLVRNSWGPKWGEKGYIRLEIGPFSTYSTRNTFAVNLT